MFLTSLVNQTRRHFCIVPRFPTYYLVACAKPSLVFSFCVNFPLQSASPIGFTPHCERLAFKTSRIAPMIFPRINFNPFCQMPSTFWYGFIHLSSLNITVISRKNCTNNAPFLRLFTAARVAVYAYYRSPLLNLLPAVFPLSSHTSVARLRALNATTSKSVTENYPKSDNKLFFCESGDSFKSSINYSNSC